jgi:hypothetical protein
VFLSCDNFFRLSVACCTPAPSQTRRFAYLSAIQLGFYQYIYLVASPIFLNPWDRGFVSWLSLLLIICGDYSVCLFVAFCIHNTLFCLLENNKIGISTIWSWGFGTFSRIKETGHLLLVEHLSLCCGNLFSDLFTRVVQSRTSYLQGAVNEVPRPKAVKI